MRKAKAKRPMRRIPREVLARSRQKPGVPEYLPFAVAQHPPEATPDTSLAMDSADFCGGNGAVQWAANALSSAFAEGQAFLGYPELAVLAQRPEYRVISETIAEEMTRKWIKLQSKGGKKGQIKKIAKINDFLKEIGAQKAVQTAIEQDGFFGRGHIYIDTGVSDERDELKMPIGNGRNTLSKNKVNEKRPVIALRNVEAVWVYPTNYNSNDPLKPDWYNPEQWFVQGKQVHKSRLLTIIGHPVSDLLKPAYSFGGLSLTQMAKPYVDNWLRTRQSVADIISAFTVFVLMTDLSTLLQENGGNALFERAELFNNLRDIRGLMMLNKDTEDFKNVSASLSTLDTLQAQTQEHMAAVSRIPIVKLLGIQPQGLNADSEGVMKTFEDHIHARQERIVREPAETLVGFAQLSLFGEIDPDIVVVFEPLREMNEKEASEIRKSDAETGDILIANGTLDPAEERARIAADEDTPYDGIDVDDMPEPPDDEEDLDIRGSGSSAKKPAGGKGDKGKGDKGAKKK